MDLYKVYTTVEKYSIDSEWITFTKSMITHGDKKMVSQKRVSKMSKIAKKPITGRA